MSADVRACSRFRQLLTGKNECPSGFGRWWLTIPETGFSTPLGTLDGTLVSTRSTPRAPPPRSPESPRREFQPPFAPRTPPPYATVRDSRLCVPNRHTPSIPVWRIPATDRTFNHFLHSRARAKPVWLHLGGQVAVSRLPPSKMRAWNVIGVSASKRQAEVRVDHLGVVHVDVQLELVELA